MKETISANKTAKQEDLIRLLNPMLRGWAQYHSPVVAKASYSRMEHLVFHALWRWAVRRHRGKNAIWIRRKYFRSVGGQNWVFGATVKGEGGEQQPRDLYSLSAMTIERHAKVKGEYNPFDPTWEMYGETLRQQRALNSMRHKSKWVSLYKSQDGLCALCGCKITSVTGWHDHHIVFRLHGGTDALSNRVLLHPDCHRKVHSLGLPVVKLASKIPKAL